MLAIVVGETQKQSAGRRILVGGLLFATLGWMALLMLVTAWPDPTIPDLGPAEGSMLVPILGHFILFAILGVLVSYYVCYIKGRQYVLVAVTVAIDNRTYLGAGHRGVSNPCGNQGSILPGRGNGCAGGRFRGPSHGRTLSSNKTTCLPTVIYQFHASAISIHT